MNLVYISDKIVFTIRTVTSDIFVIWLVGIRCKCSFYYMTTTEQRGFLTKTIIRVVSSYVIFNIAWSYISVLLVLTSITR